MPSATRHCTAALLLAAAATLAQAQAVDPARVDEAVQRMRKDPALGGTRMEKQLRLKERDRDPAKPTRPRDHKESWWERAIAWLAEGSRWILWGCGAALVAFALVRARIWMRERAAPLALHEEPPTHVQSLDIRPESLPDAIGPAAWALWSAGRHRAGLALLYRGALSRLVHQRALPLRASDTEGECLALARDRLDAAPADYFARLVAAWQLAVYAGREPAGDEVRSLCDGFAPQLELRPAEATR